MLKKKVFVFVIVTIIIFVLAIFLFRDKNTPNSTRVLLINNQKIIVEIANTDGLRTKGLSGRNSLPDNHGMLFIFSYPSNYQFWMREMRFPLDFVWINGTSIVDLSESIPVYDKNNNMSIVSSGNPFDKVLEINAGQIGSLNIKIGDRINLL